MVTYTEVQINKSRGDRLVSPNLLAICMTAFAAVFILLMVLAGTMKLITLIFPQVKAVISATHLAAIASTFQTLVPGSKITHVEETK